jgi:hypothetical protein
MRSSVRVGRTVSTARSSSGGAALVSVSGGMRTDERGSARGSDGRA